MFAQMQFGIVPQLDRFQPHLLPIRLNAAAWARVSAWIDDYNTQRRHSALRMMPPVSYERALQAGEAA